MKIERVNALVRLSQEISMENNKTQARTIRHYTKMFFLPLKRVNDFFLFTIEVFKRKEKQHFKMKSF